MKNQLFGISSLLALSIPVALFSLAPNAEAAGLVRGSTATTSLSTNVGNIANITNKSGLSTAYTSGTTDFDTYVAGTTHNSSPSGNTWAFTGTTGIITFDLGASYALNALALWPIIGGSTRAIVGFNLYADTDANTSSLGTSLGNFTAASTTGTVVGSQVFNFATTNTRYIQFQVTSNARASSGITSLGEVAFREVTPAAVPEPLTILGAATAAAFGAAFKRRKSQG